MPIARPAGSTASRTQAANSCTRWSSPPPSTLHGRLTGCTLSQLVDTAARFLPGDHPDDPDAATRLALRSLTRRYRVLTEKLQAFDAQLERLVNEAAPELVARHGIGTPSAAQLLVTAGDNPDRLDDQGSFAHLCGDAPLEATSGRRQDRHRLNVGGDRLANAALHMIALSRPRTEKVMACGWCWPGTRTCPRSRHLGRVRDLSPPELRARWWPAFAAARPDLAAQFDRATGP